VTTRAELRSALDRAVVTRGQFYLIEIMLERGALSNTLACSVWRESEKICAGAERAAARSAPDRRGRFPLGSEPRVSLVRRSFALVLNR